MIQDSQGQQWTAVEIQLLICQVGSLTKAARRLGLANSNGLRKLGMLTPTEYVRKRAEEEPKWLLDLVIRFDGRKKAAQALNVSVTFLTALLEELDCQTRHKLPTAEDARVAMEKFGSVIFAARLLDTTPAMVKKALGEEWRNLRDGTKAGNTSIQTGQIAETYFVKQRGEKIVATPAAVNHNHVGFDAVDSEYGNVNVKGSLGSTRFTWVFNRAENADCYAVVALDEAKNPLGFAVVEIVDVMNVRENAFFKAMSSTVRSSDGKIVIRAELK